MLLASDPSVSTALPDFFLVVAKLLTLSTPPLVDHSGGFYGNQGLAMADGTGDWLPDVLESEVTLSERE